MLKPGKFLFCPSCGSEMGSSETTPKACGNCDFTFWNNPIPVVAAIVETPAGVVLAHNVSWPPKIYALITGFLEPQEDPAEGVVREVKEELNLDATEATLVGIYNFEQANQVIMAYHVIADGPITLNEELDEYRIIEPAKLKPWPFGTGLAVRDWMLSQGLQPPEPTMPGS